MDVTLECWLEKIMRRILRAVLSTIMFFMEHRPGSERSEKLDPDLE